jgi:sodium/hydrogen exchanger-like protein 6/7
VHLFNHLEKKVGLSTHYNSRLYNYHHQFQSQNLNNTPLSPVGAIFSAASSKSYDSDGDVLPLAPTPHENNSHTLRANISSMVGEDGKWFQALDERYLLPIFSNATASRTFHARRARRSSGVPLDGMQGGVLGTPADSEDEVDLGDQEIELLGRPIIQPVPKPLPTSHAVSKSALGEKKRRLVYATLCDGPQKQVVEVAFTLSSLGE